MNSYRSVTALLCAAALTACSKDALQDITGPASGGSIRFFNFGVNAPGVNFYANDAKLTAITSATGAEAVLGTTYGTAGNAGLYSAVAAGSYTFAGKIAAATDKDVAVSKVTATVADGKYYSFFMSGFYDAAVKSVEGFVVEDALPAQGDYNVAYVRFVNAISNSSPMILYAKNTSTGTEIAVGASVPYKSGGAFTALPTGVYDLSTRNVGSATSAIARTGVAFIAGRAVTIGARGDMTVVSTTATNRPMLDVTLNR
ncbi:MAG TPA: hypothetical protein VK636_15510 [Gemmatimonadaceae bacterium]|nr:hypothetical protein [Gemmatimonadaceae bacterium]